MIEWEQSLKLSRADAVLLMAALDRPTTPNTRLKAAASDSVAFPVVVVVDAKDGAKQFYERFGFQAFQETENKLFITIADIRLSLG